MGVAAAAGLANSAISIPLTSVRCCSDNCDAATPTCCHNKYYLPVVGVLPSDVIFFTISRTFHKIPVRIFFGINVLAFSMRGSGGKTYRYQCASIGVLPRGEGGRNTFFRHLTSNYSTSTCRQGAGGYLTPRPLPQTLY